MYIQSTSQVPKRYSCAHRPRLGLMIALLVLPAGTGWAANPEAATTGNAPSYSTLNLSQPEQTVGPGRWLGPNQELLPFADDQEILDFLAGAEITKLKQLNSGSTKPWKVMLEQDGVKAHAIFRTVDKSSGTGHRAFEDNYSFEVAAYQTARLLGLDQVPPAVLRVVDREEGSLQLWVEGARSETERIAKGEAPKQASKMVFQKHMMRVFDHLIYNFDRNTGNMLLDGQQKLWLVDHTRAFKALPVLPDGPKVTLCERDMWQHLVELDSKKLRKQLSPYLSPIQVSALAKRHKKLVEHLSRLIDEQGEQGVLFEL